MHLTNYTAPCLGVLVPAYNERATITQTLNRVLAQPSVVEVVVIDDGSTDDTADLVAQLAVKEPRLNLIKHARNLGKGAAIKTGLSRSTAPFIIIQDADLEYDPTDYGELLRPVLAGEADVVYGSRFMQRSKSRTTTWHSLQNRLITFASNLATGMRLSDEATCYKLFRREVFDQLTLKENRFGFCPEVTVKISQLGLRIIEVPVSYNSRTRASGKKLRLRDGFDAVRCLIKYSLQKKGRSGRF
jgi:glycosyltransferase involved in cell wall biosynthesis